jgi:hypothetical protein
MFIRENLCDRVQSNFPDVLHCSIVQGRDSQRSLLRSSRFRNIYSFDRLCPLQSDIRLLQLANRALFYTGTIPKNTIDSRCLRPFIGTYFAYSCGSCLPSSREVILQLLHTCKTFFTVYQCNFHLHVLDKIFHIVPVDGCPLVRYHSFRICSLHRVPLPFDIFSLFQNN